MMPSSSDAPAEGPDSVTTIQELVSDMDRNEQMTRMQRWLRCIDADASEDGEEETTRKLQTCELVVRRRRPHGAPFKEESNATTTDDCPICERRTPSTFCQPFAHLCAHSPCTLNGRLRRAQHQGAGHLKVWAYLLPPMPDSICEDAALLRVDHVPLLPNLRACARNRHPIDG